MKLYNNSKFFVSIGCLMVLSLAHVGQSHPLMEGGGGSAVRLIGRDAEYGSLTNQSPQTDPELNSLENLQKQQQRLQMQSNFARKQQFNNNNNEQDVAPFSQYPPSLRQQQQQHLKQSAVVGFPLNNKASQFPLQQLQFEDEHAMRRQLPDLIAQAHTDKTVERALLKMLINASLRSAMTNAAAAAASSSGSAYTWRQDGSGADASALDGSLPMSARMSARLEQVADEFAGIDPALGSNDLLPYSHDQQQQQQQYGPTAIGKREYIKPCFFNAVACAKNPFRETS